MLYIAFAGKSGGYNPPAPPAPPPMSMAIVDASPVGISAILAQREPNSQQYKIISYASRQLKLVERRYSQTDREALALVWGIEH